MPRTAALLNSGILSVIDAAAIVCVSEPTIRRWFDEGLLTNTYKQGNERRIPAPSLITYLTLKGIPIPTRLSELAEKYNTTYQSKPTTIRSLTPTLRRKS